MKVAIQGIKGSYHHIVAEQYFGTNTKLIECMTFSEMPDLLHTKEASSAIMAIENSIAGALLPNYALIDEQNLSISGEYYLPILHNLMVLNGQKIEEIKEVYSHPMALLQCRKFFKDYPHIKLIEDQDTAEVARRIQKKKLKGIGAIASVRAAEYYNLTILAAEIQTIKNNATRFVILNNSGLKTNPLADKASIKFILEHKMGSLGEVLQVFSKHKLSLSKIQSLPVIESPWEYAFFADLVFGSYQDYQSAMHEVVSKVSDLKILGEYKKSKR